MLRERLMSKLDAELDQIICQTRSALADGCSDFFVPTLTVLTADQVHIHGLLAGLEEGQDLLAEVEAFAYRTWKRGKQFDSVFFAAESIGPGNDREIMVSGCIEDGTRVLAFLPCRILPSGNMVAAEDTRKWANGRGASERLPAAAALAGLRRKRDSRWWQME